MTIPKENEFFDINKFPKGWGIISMPISMSRISTGQNAKKCVDWVLDFGGNKVSEPKVGVNFIYTDFLYLSSSESANSLKKLFMIEIIKHKNQLQKLIFKNRKNLQIQSAFTYQGWSDFYIHSPKFDTHLRETYDFYNKDLLFQKYVQQDADNDGRLIDVNQLSFYIEEHLVSYLYLYGVIKLRNEFVQGREDWMLWMYPGNPPKGLVYLVQQNPLGLKSDNPFIGQYNLDNKKFYDFSRLNLEVWNYN